MAYADNLINEQAKLGEAVEIKQPCSQCNKIVWISEACAEMLNDTGDKFVCWHCERGA